MDVTYNLQSLYKKLGFLVFFSRKLHDADLLVVTRPLDRDYNSAGFNYPLIHIYDYTGWSYDAFVRSIDYSKTFIFCTSESVKERLLSKFTFPPERVFIALPPSILTFGAKN